MSDEEDKPSIAPVSMALLLGLSLHQLELLRFYHLESVPVLCEASGKDVSRWLRNVGLVSQSQALKQACLVFASVHLDHVRSASSRSEHVSSSRQQLSLPDIPRNVQLPDTSLAKLLTEFIVLLQQHRRELQNLSLTTYPSALATSVIIYTIAVSLGPLIPLVNFEGGADLFQVTRNVMAISTDPLLGFSQPLQAPFFPPKGRRVLLPREEDLWGIVKLVDKSDHSDYDKRHLKFTLTGEIYSLLHLFHLDTQFNSVGHTGAWCNYWRSGFVKLRYELNPYALLLISYYCAYAHLFHQLFWLADRTTDTVFEIVEYLPEEFKKYAEWPLQMVRRFDYGIDDLLTGKLRKLSICTRRSVFKRRKRRKGLRRGGCKSVE
ncbi:hypothetical protein CJU89_3637 [Yarrowia sp. B02]|nr:hypothetical protein CJU89_3637 [Yarrowia sp. B02]